MVAKLACYCLVASYPAPHTLVLYLNNNYNNVQHSTKVEKEKGV